MLCKAKRIDNGEWLEGQRIDYTAEGDRHTFLVCSQVTDFHALSFAIGGYPFACYEVDPATICRQTGLRDANSKEIWEGDKVHIWSDFYQKDMPCAVVFWNEKHAGFDLKVSDGQYHNWLSMGHHQGWFIEVIDNPELAEKS